jgi:hypothetical protein
MDFCRLKFGLREDKASHGAGEKENSKSQQTMQTRTVTVIWEKGKM